MSLEERKLVGEMLATDEFHSIQESKDFAIVDLVKYRYYEEEEIRFPPTYKFKNEKFDP